VIRSAVESDWQRMGTRKVVNERSKGRMGSIPCAMKNGAHLVDLQVVAARSAQKISGARVGHLELSPSQAFTSDWRIVWCWRSTSLLASEL